MPWERLNRTGGRSDALRPPACLAVSLTRTVISVTRWRGDARQVLRSRRSTILFGGGVHQRPHLEWMIVIVWLAHDHQGIARISVEGHAGLGHGSFARIGQRNRDVVCPRWHALALGSSA